jgi:hypothetical protein
MRTLCYLGLVLQLSILFACGSSETVCSGDEGCACYPNHTCDTGLRCGSSLCVRLDDAVSVTPPTAATPLGQQSDPVTAQSAGGAPIAQSSVAGRTSPPDTGAAGSGAEAKPAAASGVHGAAGTIAVVGCTPKCGDAECGPDPICQTSCGECAAGLECLEGVCHAPAPLRKNGETCSGNQDCASDNCGKNRVGEALCYGTAGPNDPCRDVFDCNGGTCIAKIEGGDVLVCVDGLNACDALGILNTCTADLAVATCQFDELCNTPKQGLDFNSCVQFGCGYWNDNPPSTGCPSQLAFVRGGKGNCSN